MKVPTSILIMLFIFGASHAVSEVRLNSAISQHELGLYADILKDPSGTLTIEQVSSADYQKHWVRSEQAVPNFSFSDNTYWLRIAFTSELEFSKTYWFELAFALQDYIDYYIFKEGAVEYAAKTGDRLPFDSRPFEYRNFLFDFPIAPNETKTIYLRLGSHDGIHEPSPIILWDKEAFTFASNINSLGLGLYFGIMIVMVIYNLFIYFVVKDVTYIYYVLYISGFMSWLATYYGYCFQYFWPNNPDWGNQVILLTSAAWFICMIHFVSSFLDTKRTAPWFENLKKLLIVFVSIFVILSFSGLYRSLIIVIVSFGISSSIICLAVAYISYRKGLRQAKYFLLAWTTFLVSLTVFSLKIVDILPSIVVVEKSIQIGSVLEVMLLSLGLADRINVLKREKIQAQEESIRASESSLKLKNDFLTSVSHELRTPMNAIMGGLQVAQSHQQERLKPPFDSVQDGASEMMRLVNDILTHTEIQSQNLRIESRSTDMLSFLEFLKQRYQYLCDKKQLELHWNVDNDFPKWLMIDERKLQIIFSKLLDNAVKFTAKGEIKYTVSCNQETVPWGLTCIIEDSGVGIDREKQAHIFDAFTQSDAGFQRGFGGLGIGLAICQSLTKAVGGELSLESVVGKGCSFKVDIPVVIGEKPEYVEPRARALSELPILIVEDNLVNQKIMVKMLEKLGYCSLIANNGIEGLEVIQQKEVSVILMDLQMPLMDGFCCAQEIRKNKSLDIPIIAVTANLMDADKARCIDSGMNDFLEKPVKLNVLRSSLLQYVEEPVNSAPT